MAYPKPSLTVADYALHWVRVQDTISTGGRIMKPRVKEKTCFRETVVFRERRLCFWRNLKKISIFSLFYCKCFSIQGPNSLTELGKNSNDSRVIGDIRSRYFYLFCMVM